MTNCSPVLQPSSETIDNRCRVVLIILAATLVSLPMSTLAQSTSPSQQDVIAIEGTVRNAAGESVAGAFVFLEQKGHSTRIETKTNADGTFLFSLSRPGTYIVLAGKPGYRDALSDTLALSSGDKKRVGLVLESLGTVPPPSSDSLRFSGPSKAMEFDDKPSFTVAGITDWTNIGLHGSDISSRTSEALTKETLALKSGGPGLASTAIPRRAAKNREAGESESKLRAALLQTPGSFDLNHQLGQFYFLSQRYRDAIPLLEAAYRINPGNHANAYDLALAYKGHGDFAKAREQALKMLNANPQRAEVHRLLGDVNERLGDPLGAVREYELAVRLDPSEQSYFEWGTELLLHKAAGPAIEVFTKGSAVHPDSPKLLTGLGAALYASGSHDEAAQRLCAASDLQPAEPDSYLFLGKMEEANPELLPCSEQRLARFLRQQPGNALANYYLALSLWKRQGGSDNAGLQEVEGLLEKAVAIDPNLGEAYMQLGSMYFARGRFEQAIRAYNKAIEASPQLGKAHYQLSLAYKRVGEESKAHQEFQMYEQAEKTQAAAIERERRELRQFVIILRDRDQQAGSAPH